MNSVSGPATGRPEPKVGESDNQGWTLARVRRAILWRLQHWPLRARDAVLLPLAAGSQRLSSIYYAIANGAFGREHRGVLVGRSQFRRLSQVSANHHYQLRRNVHRVEKGLIMRPRRPSFGASYIEEAVGMYATVLERQAADPGSVDSLELKWAHDVLAEYFAVVERTGRVRRAGLIWDRLRSIESSGDCVPYPRDLTGPPPVAYEDLQRLAIRRRSVRWYLTRPVPRELIDKALDVAAQSPSACNRQPFEFRIFDEPALLREVLAVPQGTGGFGQQIPAAAVIVGRLRAFATERDRHLIYIDGGLAAMSFVLALESLGLSSVCINWADLAPQEKEMGRLLHLAADERVVMLIGFGYPDPDGLVPYSQKKPLELFRRYNA